jgi:hypothetical protein
MVPLLPTQKPPSPQVPTLWQNIGKVMGRVFKKISHFPEFLVGLVAKVKNVVGDLFKKNSPFSSEPLSFSEPTSSPASPSDFPSSVSSSPLGSSGISSQSIKENAVDVPDDGNCLFYAIAIGLCKKYAEHTMLSDWGVNLAEIDEIINESKRIKADKKVMEKHKEFLSVPAKTLRDQAADYLKNNREELIFVLIEGISTHNEEMRKRNLSDLIIDDDNYENYINCTKEDRFYCGTAQIYALSLMYKIPIKLLKDGQQPVTFNEIVNQDHIPLPVLTIAHVNGNHFQFIND